jgi:putative acetyltransferase
MCEVREETPEDIEVVRALNRVAFGQPDEGAIVDALRAQCPDLISLVAVDEDEVVGHIMFSPVTLEGGSGGMGLAPMAVLPDRQRDGIGSSLVREGLSRLHQDRCAFVIVLGHPEYYPRFGFEPASQYGLACQWEGVPDEAFMVLILDPEAMKGTQGVTRYRPEFDPAD